MFTTEPTVTIRITFQDRNGNQGRTNMYLPFSASDNDVLRFVNTYMPPLQALSNGKIVGWTATWSAKNFAPDMPSLDSDVTRNVVLIYRQDDIFDWIWIPSGRTDLLENIGPYAGVRLDDQRPDVIDLLDDWQAVIEAITNSRGDAFPVEFVIGGIGL